MGFEPMALHISFASQLKASVWFIGSGCSTVVKHTPINWCVVGSNLATTTTTASITTKLLRSSSLVNSYPLRYEPIANLHFIQRRTSCWVVEILMKATLISTSQLKAVKSQLRPITSSSRLWWCISLLLHWAILRFLLLCLNYCFSHFGN